MALEQPGAWGKNAFTASQLDPVLGARLERSVVGAGGRALLIRAYSQRRETAPDSPRRVLVSLGMTTGQPILLSGLVTEVARLADVDWDAVARGERQALSALPELVETREPVLLVCTNAKRDLDCSLRGRAIAGFVTAQRGEAVWECTHTGGHRYAATGVVLPSGAMLGRLHGLMALSALDAAGRGELPTAALGARHFRGLSHLAAPAQAADAFVRAETAEGDLGALAVSSEPVSDGLWLAHITHRDGRVWRVQVRADVTADLPVSCGAEPKPATTYAVTPA